MNDKIIYKKHEWANGIRVARKNERGEWCIFVGKQGGDFRTYKTESGLDKEMAKRGFEKCAAI